MATLTLENLTKRYDRTEVLHGINIDIADGEFVVLVGPSGCGKSTTLRMIAGLESISEGTITIGDRLVNNLEPKDRNIAMVFQNYAIYPHMSVRKNIGFGLRTSKLSKQDKHQRVIDVAGTLGMSDLLDRKPDQLSGGQRQRVAIGRALVRDPDIFLFDEPLSNLDAQLRTQMRLEIKKLHQRVGKTIVFVTHDQIEAMTLADRIVIMKDGHIQQTGTPYEVFHRPNNTFVAQFIGAPAMNLLSGIWRDGSVQLQNGNRIPVNGIQAEEGQRIAVGLRPDDLAVSTDQTLLSGDVVLTEPLGAETLVYVSVNDQEIIAKAPGRSPPAAGDTISMFAEPENIHLFDADSGTSLRDDT